MLGLLRTQVTVTVAVAVGGPAKTYVTAGTNVKKNSEKVSVLQALEKMSLRKRLDESKILIAPGCYDGFSAKLIELSAFEAVYLTGAGVSYSTLGFPDLGFITQTEMVDKISAIAQATPLPIIADGDTGYGNAMNTMRTIRLYEAAGASAIQLEDQVFPKRCGHLAGKKVIPTEEMIGKIKAACEARRSKEFLIIARTDARTVIGLKEALKRAEQYTQAGADIIFVESPHTEAELREIAQNLKGIKLLANMVEGGKTPLVENRILEEMGYRLVIYPNMLLRGFAKTGMEILKEMKEKGTTKDLMKEKMLDFKQFNEVLGLSKFSKLEEQFVVEKEGK